MKLNVQPEGTKAAGISGKDKQKAWIKRVKSMVHFELSTFIKALEA